MSSVSTAINSKFISTFNNQEIEGRKLVAHADCLFDGYYRYSISAYLFEQEKEMIVHLYVIPFADYNFKNVEEWTTFEIDRTHKSRQEALKWVRQNNYFDGTHRPLSFIDWLQNINSTEFKKEILPEIAPYQVELVKNSKVTIKTDLDVCFVSEKELPEFKLSSLDYINVHFSALTSINCKRLDFSEVYSDMPWLLSESSDIKFEYMMLNLASIIGAHYSMSYMGDELENSLYAQLDSWDGFDKIQVIVFNYNPKMTKALRNRVPSYIKYLEEDCHKQVIKTENLSREYLDSIVKKQTFLSGTARNSILVLV